MEEANEKLCINDNKFKKSDLNDGMKVICRDGSFGFIVKKDEDDEYIQFVSEYYERNGYLRLDGYDDNLKDKDGDNEFDIVEVFGLNSLYKRKK